MIERPRAAIYLKEKVVKASLLVFCRERRVKATMSERMFVLIRDDDDDR